MNIFINSSVQYENQKIKNACFDTILLAIESNIKTRQEFLKIKKKICAKYSISFITNPLLLRTYYELLENKKIKKNDNVFELLRKRRIRTSSGIVSVALLTKPYHCKGKCIFCPTQKNTPKSYLSNEPAVMRAILANYDPIKQINIRLRGLELAGNSANKIELIIMGGTWSNLPKLYQLQYIISCYVACNNYKTTQQINEMRDFFNQKKSIKSLEKILIREQRKNESSNYKIIGLTLETRPDCITKKELLWFRVLGCTRVEIGVQSIYDRILNSNKRGHLVARTIAATKILKDAGFKINYHMMPNLFGSSIAQDQKMFQEIFSDSRYQPDMLKIYPCMVTKYSKLYSEYKKNNYIPLTDTELIDLLVKIKKDIPFYVRIQRMIRDIPAESIIAGSRVSNLRQIIQNKYGKICNCIRCREIREFSQKKIHLHRFDYSASGGKEIFLEYIDKDNRIYGLLRLRIPSNIFNGNEHWISILNNCAIVREVHVFGQVVQVGKKNNSKTQHKGLGKRLIEKAEEIVQKEFKLNKIAVISGIGVRAYYKKSGYSLRESYMVKKLK